MNRCAAVATIVVGILSISASAKAEVTIEWVHVGDIGNVDDTHGLGFGGVEYSYLIAKYEVTNAQYAEFLNAVAAADPHSLYNPSMNVGPEGTGGIIRSGSYGSYIYAPIAGQGNTPVDYVCFYDALRFANWLHNGQPSGTQNDSTTEDGAYDMSLGVNVVRKEGARVFLPTEDEWYKPAYYKGGSLNAGYWDYATQSNTLPAKEPPAGGSNSANYDRIDDPAHPDHHLTDGGAYTASVSPYGTFDQTGNVWEWNEELVDSNRGLRGGSWMWGPGDLPAYFRYATVPTTECSCIGFRIAARADCNNNGIPDECDLDCGESGGPCDVAGCGQSNNCNDNGIPDECDITDEVSDDCQPDGIPDECQLDDLIILGGYGPCSPTANNGEAWCDDFEDYPLGTIQGRNGWTGFGADPGLAGSVTTAQNHTPAGSQSLSLVLEDTLRPLSGYDRAAASSWIARAWIFVPSTMTGPAFFTVNSDYSGAIQGTIPGAKVRAEVTRGLLYNDLTNATLPLITDEWVELVVMINLGQDRVAIYYDGRLLDEHAWTIRGGSLEIAAMHPIGDESSGFYCDDLSVHPARWFTSDCNGNNIPNACDIESGASGDSDLNGIPDDCEVGPPLLPPSPHETSKNRYISFDPSNPGNSIAVQVEMTASGEFPDSTGVLGWASEPEEPMPGEYISRVVDAPVFRVWDESVIHLGDCEIVPDAVYELRATIDELVFSDPLEVGTILRPGALYYGDVVGKGTGNLPPLSGFTPPNGVVNVTDIQAYILTAQGTSSPSTHTTWVDLHGLGDGSPPNFLTNVSDLQRIKFGFEGQPYAQSPDQLDPADCP